MALNYGVKHSREVSITLVKVRRLLQHIDEEKLTYDKSGVLHTIIYLHFVLIATNLLIDVLLITLRPMHWEPGAIGVFVAAVLYFMNVVALRFRPSVMQGISGLLGGAFIGIWIAILGMGYSVISLLWLSIISWFAILLVGYKVGLIFSIGNLAVFLIYHYITWTVLAATNETAEILIIGNPHGFQVSFSLFLICTALVGAFFDYNRQRFQNQLILSERKRMLYLKQTSMAVIETKANGAITDWNGAAETIFGYVKSEVLHQDLFALLDFDKEEVNIQWLHQELHQTRNSEVKLTIHNRTQNGQIIFCEWFITPIWNEQGTITNFILSIVDMTERLAREHQLEQSRAQAEAATQAKSAFLANMSHEIRTPMNGVIGMTSVLAQTELTEEQSEYVEIIRKSGNSLLDIINEILDFSKIESGKLVLEAHPFSLNECLQDVTDLFKTSVQEKGVSLEYKINPSVPESILGDSGRIRQVLVNLVGNAIKFTESGSINLYLDKVERSKSLAILETQTAPSAEEIDLHFSVQDSGIGIPEEKLDLLFESFSQADVSTTRKYGGTGLGLTISKKLIELMGGEIWVKSKVGEGSTFHFTVRLQQLSALHRALLNQPSEELPRPEGDPTNASFPQMPLSILLVEDNLVNQKVALHFLKKLGYQADTAANGLEAVQAAERQAYDLILMDIQMPEMDGLEATKEIRRRLSPDTQPIIIAMSASVLAEDKREASAVGMNEFISKPVQIDILGQKLGQIKPRSIDIIHEQL